MGQQAGGAHAARALPGTTSPHVCVHVYARTRSCARALAPGAWPLAGLAAGSGCGCVSTSGNCRSACASAMARMNSSSTRIMKWCSTYHLGRVQHACGSACVLRVLQTQYGKWNGEDSLQGPVWRVQHGSAPVRASVLPIAPHGPGLWLQTSTLSSQHHLPPAPPVPPPPPPPPPCARPAPAPPPVRLLALAVPCYGLHGGHGCGCLAARALPRRWLFLATTPLAGGGGLQLLGKPARVRACACARGTLLLEGTQAAHAGLQQRPLPCTLTLLQPPPQPPPPPPPLLRPQPLPPPPPRLLG